MDLARGRLRPARRLAAWLATLTLLASCGGGDRVGTFIPGRLIAFGDETSVITPDGRKHTVNAVDTAGALDCACNPNWVQYLSRPSAWCSRSATLPLRA